MNLFETETLQAYKDIKRKIFSENFKSKNCYLEWNGDDCIEFGHILKLYYSYDFKKMEKKENHTIQNNNDINILIKYRQLQKKLVYMLILSLSALFLIIYLYFSNFVTLTPLVIVIIFVYFININLPHFIRKKIAQNKYIDLS